MNKPLTTVERSVATPPATKPQRLQRFANVIRSGPRVSLSLHQSGIPRCRRMEISRAPLSTAFALAAKDSVLHDAGLTGDSVGDAHRFFDLSRQELADFSCACGGSINNNEMADRIERIAARSAT